MNRKIDYFLISGDTHRNFSRFKKITHLENVGVIILGDAGVNYTLSGDDDDFKKSLKKFNLTFYLVRGNHEARPQKVCSMEDIHYDENVQGEVFIQEEYPYIRYFLDGGEYVINGLRTLVIGGAYSVDKWYRLERWKKYGGVKGWFEDEQLDDYEKYRIEQKIEGKEYDLVLTHTCPYSWRPIDLFLRSLDQNSVDSSMEIWFEKLKDKFTWHHWLFGHYHDDRIVRPHVEMFSTDVVSLNDVISTWAHYDKTKELDPCLNIDPYFEEGSAFEQLD